MSDIAEACSIKKPSVYHHVDSRSDLLLAVVEEVIQRFSDDVLALAYKDTVSPRDSMQATTVATADFFTDGADDCLIAQLVYEISDTSDDLAKLLQLFFEKWTQALSHLFAAQYGDAARSHAEDCIAQVEGALLISSVTSDQAVFKRSLDRMLDLIS